MCFRILPHSVQTPFSRFLTDFFLVLWLAINFVGTPACCVQRVSSELCHKQISRISRNKRHFCEIGEICVREISSDAARNVPLTLIQQAPYNLAEEKRIGLWGSLRERVVSPCRWLPIRLRAGEGFGNRHTAWRDCLRLWDHNVLT